MSGVNDVRAHFEGDSKDLKALFDAILIPIERIINKSIAINAELFLCLITKINEDPFNSVYVNSIIDDINTKLLELCARYNIKHIDYNQVLVNEFNLLDKSLADDGLHPNRFGYLKMVDLLGDVLHK